MIHLVIVVMTDTSVRQIRLQSKVELKILKEKIDKLINNGKEMDQQVHSDLIEVMNNHL